MPNNAETKPNMFVRNKFGSHAVFASVFKANAKHTFVQGSVLMGKLRVNGWSPMKGISGAFRFINFLVSTFKF